LDYIHSWATIKWITLYLKKKKKKKTNQILKYYLKKKLFIMSNFEHVN